MTHKERILAALKGLPTDVLPFVPRMDLWYKANKKNDTLPDKYKNATLWEIVEDMDLGFHAIVPDFQDLRSEDDDLDRALGIYNLWFMPYRCELRNIERVVRRDSDYTTVEYITPPGTIRTRVLYNEQMRKAGITITHIDEYAIKKVDDLKVIDYIFSNIEIVPNYAGFDDFADRLADRGVAVAFISLAASAMHLIMRELMRMDEFFLLLFDCRDEVLSCAETIDKYFAQIFSIVADSSAEVIFSGANYDSSVTNPRFFAEFITPTLKHQAEVLHSKNKFLLTHTDGENKGLLDEYLKANIDIADSVCPEPMTRLTFRQYRDKFKDRITIWGGIPSIVTLDESMSDKAFYKYMDDLFENLDHGKHLILSIADTLPPSAKFDRIEYIAKMARNFGPVNN